MNPLPISADFSSSELLVQLMLVLHIYKPLVVLIKVSWVVLCGHGMNSTFTESEVLGHRDCSLASAFIEG